MALFFRVPVDEKFPVSSPFGWRRIKLGDMVVPAWQFHSGEDRACPIGTEGHPAYKGIVAAVWAGFRAGLCMRMEHPTCSAPGFRVETVYFHLLEARFREMRWVDEWEVAFLTGNSGAWSTGPHLHHSVLINGRHIDPRVAYDRNSGIG